ncbi:MAG: hypothetical protein ACOCVG_02550 [Verrucomicrobiota bacterium]
MALALKHRVCYEIATRNPSGCLQAGAVREPEARFSRNDRHPLRCCEEAILLIISEAAEPQLFVMRIVFAFIENTVDHVLTPFGMGDVAGEEKLHFPHEPVQE